MYLAGYHLVVRRRADHRDHCITPDRSSLVIDELSQSGVVALASSNLICGMLGGLKLRAGYSFTGGFDDVLVQIRSKPEQLHIIARTGP